MMIAHIDGATRICGKAQGYLGLPLRDELIDDTVNGKGTPAMVTAWQPTPEELEALNRGASVHVRILGTTPPPMMVLVGPAPAIPEQDPHLSADSRDVTELARRHAARWGDHSPSTVAMLEAFGQRLMRDAAQSAGRYARLLDVAKRCVESYPVASGRAIVEDRDGYGWLRELRLAVDEIETSAPAFQAPQNTAERPPSSDAAEAGADTRLSAAAPVETDSLHDSRNPNHGRIGGLRDADLPTAQDARGILGPAPEHCSAGNAESFTPNDAWDELVNKDDRTSPEEYPEMCLITFEELKDYMERHTIAEPQEAPTCPGKGWLAPALESAERRAAEMPDWMRRDKAPEDEGELVVTQYQLMAAQSALREIAGMSHNCRSVDIAKAALAMTRPNQATPKGSTT